MAEDGPKAVVDEPEPIVDGLRSVGSRKSTGLPAAAGMLLLMGAVALAFLAPSPLWFLVYPLLIVGSLAGLATAVVRLLRNF